MSLIKENLDQILFFILKSNEYFPGPHINTIIKPRKNKIAFSFLEKGSPACEINAATYIVIIGKIEKNLVFKPIIINIGAINSPRTAKYRDNSFPSPIGSENLILSSKRRKNFPYPWVNIKIENPILSIKSPKFCMGIKFIYVRQHQTFLNNIK